MSGVDEETLKANLSQALDRIRDLEADLRSLEAEYENLRLHRDRLWRERDELRADLRRLYGPGDLLQSSASRMAEYVRNRQRVAGEGAVPYEVQMAALESEDAVEDWTAARAALDPTREQEE